MSKPELTSNSIRLRKRTVLAAVAAVLCLGAATLVFAVPGPAACSIVGYSGLEALRDGTLVQSESSEGERQQFLALQQQARARIAESFGPSRAQPIVVFLKDARAFWPFSFNDYASTHFIGSRACVVVGPKGMNVDVVAHEMMHAELFERVGYWIGLALSLAGI